MIWRFDVNNKYIVRADFYPDGNVIPIGLTDSSGNTLWIQKIKKKSYIGTSDYQFECVANGRNITLLLKDNHWIVSK